MSKTWQERPWRAVVAAGMVVVANACADQPTAPSVRPSLDVAEASTALEENVFVSNARKYSDAGKHPGTGKTGGATLSAQALLAGDGTGVVEVAAGEWDGWTRSRKMRDEPDGGAMLSKVQLKAFDPAGENQYTQNFNHVASATATLPANGIMRGGRVQFHANVRHSDYPTTEVVVVDAPVLLRPDLAVTALQRPPRAVKNTAVPIVAVVRELNGDLGAWADCVLYVNGVETDRAYGIWVDAGGTVTCTMVNMFRAVGESQLEVRVERVAPSDYDLANNTAAGTMSVIFVPSAFFFDAAFEDRTFSSTSTYESSWSYEGGRVGGETATTDELTGRVQQSYLSAFMPEPVAFPIGELFARQYTRDETAHSVLFRQLPASSTYQDEFSRSSCVSRGYDQPATGRGWLYVCSYELFTPEGGVSGFTTVQYDRYAGDVTYASRGHSRFWNQDLGIDDVYSHNYSFRDLVGRFVSYGLEYGFFVRIIDRGRTFTVNPFIGLLPFESVQHMPRTCWSWEDSWGSSRSCSEWTSEDRGVRGWVSGEPSR